MAITDTDKLLINDGSKTETITFSQFKNGTMLNDTDKFLVNDGSKTETVTWSEIQDEIGPSGVIDPPVAVLTPFNGAGTNAGTPYNPLSTAITAVGVAGSAEYKTDTIANVVDQNLIPFTMPGLSTNTGVYYQNSGGPYTISWNGAVANQDYIRFIWSYKSADSISIDGDVVGGPFVLVNEGVQNAAVGVLMQVSAQSGTATVTLTNQNGQNNFLIPEGSPDYSEAIANESKDVAPAGNILTFPSAKDFDKFEVGDVVQGFTKFSTLFTGQFEYPNTVLPPNEWLFANPQDANTAAVYSKWDGSLLTWATTDFANASQVRLVYRSSGSHAVFINGIDASGDLPTTTAGDATITLSKYGGGLKSIAYSGTNGTAYFGLLQIYVDGVRLLDSDPVTITSPPDVANKTITVSGGSWYALPPVGDGSGDAPDPTWNASQEWDASLTTTSELGESTKAIDLFDGDTTSGILIGPGAISGSWDATFTTSIPCTNLEIYVSVKQLQASGTVSVNGGAEQTISTTGWVPLTAPAGGTLTSIKMTRISAAMGDNDFRYSALKVNSKILVSSSLSSATVVSKVVTSDASLTFTDDTELANMVGPLTQVDENGDVKTPVTSTIASVAETVLSLPAKEGNSALSYNEASVIADLVAGQRSQTTSNLLWIKISDLSAPLNLTYVSGDNFYIQGYNDPNDYASGTLVYDQSGTYSLDSSFGYLYARVYAGGGGNIVYDYSYSAAGTVLTFESPNPELQLFKEGDNVGTGGGFAPVIYSGNGGTQSITTGFSPSLVWLKKRNEADSHELYDAIRGAGSRLFSNLTSAADPTKSSLAQFNSDGFSLNNAGYSNAVGGTYVAWCWEASDTAETNNDGDIESQVRSNGNFSVVTYTNGNGSVGHGLSAPPALMLIKTLDLTYVWAVYFKDFEVQQYLELDTDSGIKTIAGFWGATAPTDKTFNATEWQAPVDIKMVAYCWAETPGVSSFGEYDGNGSATGPVIDCGFKPAMIIIKSFTEGSWFIYDTARGPTNPNDNELYANLSSDEYEIDRGIDFLLNGFQIKTNDNNLNSSGSKYIYAAFAGSNPIEVIDVDVAKNQMIVDGGDWGVYNQKDWTGTTTANVSSGSISALYDGTVAADQVVINANTNLVVSNVSVTASSIAVNTDGTNDCTLVVTDSSDSIVLSQVFAPDPGTGAWEDFALPSDTNIKTITIQNGSTGTGVNGIKLGGKLLVDSSVTPTGETKVTGPELVASANDVEYLDGTTLGVSGVSGSWREGLRAQGAEVTSSAPSPDSIQYTSANGNPLTTQFTGTDATLTTRTWTWQISNAVTGPWTDFATRTDTPGQDGATELTDRPTLEENKFYQVKVKYNSENAESVESTFNTFKTGVNS